MSPTPRQYEAIVALLAANDLTNSAIRDKQDAHELVTMKHREAGRILGAKDDALRFELHENAAKTRALRAEKEARCAVNNREPMYRTGES